MNENLQAVVASVNNLLTDTDNSTVVQSTVERLVSFGYCPTEDDAWMIAYTIKGTINHVKNETNQSEIPISLYEIVVDMICGEFLNTKFMSGQLNLENLDLDGMIQSVNLGGASVSFGADGSDEAKLKELLSWLISGKGCDLVCYRKMRW
jgi:hypothetical protein